MVDFVPFILGISEIFSFENVMSFVVVMISICPDLIAWASLLME